MFCNLLIAIPLLKQIETQADGSGLFGLQNKLIFSFDVTHLIGKMNRLFLITIGWQATVIESLKRVLLHVLHGFLGFSSSLKLSVQVHVTSQQPGG